MAISLGLDALKSKDDYRDAWIVIGHAYFAEKKYSDARAALERSIELDSTLALSHFYIGLTLGALNEHEKAIAELEKAESMEFDGGFLASGQKAKSFDALQQFEKAYGDFKVAYAKVDLSKLGSDLQVAAAHEEAKKVASSSDLANYLNPEAQETVVAAAIPGPTVASTSGIDAAAG